MKIMDFQKHQLMNGKQGIRGHAPVSSIRFQGDAPPINTPTSGGSQDNPSPGSHAETDSPPAPVVSETAPAGTSNPSSGPKPADNPKSPPVTPPKPEKPKGFWAKVKSAASNVVQTVKTAVQTKIEEYRSPTVPVKPSTPGAASETAKPNGNPASGQTASNPVPNNNKGTWLETITDAVPILKKPVEMVQGLQQRAAIDDAMNKSGLGDRLQQVSAFARENVSQMLDARDKTFFQPVIKDTNSIFGALNTLQDTETTNVFAIQQLPAMINQSKTIQDWNALAIGIQSFMAVHQFSKGKAQIGSLHVKTDQMVSMRTAVDTVLELKEQRPQVWTALRYLAESLSSQGKDSSISTSTFITLGTWLNLILGKGGDPLPGVSEDRMKIFNQLLVGRTPADIARLITEKEGQFLMVMDLTLPAPDKKWIQAHEAALQNAKPENSPRELMVRILRNLSEAEA